MDFPSPVPLRAIASTSVVDRLGRLVAAIGGRDFEDELTSSAREAFACDHCVVFVFPRGGDPGWRLTDGRIREPVARRLAEAYVERYFTHDPNFPSIVDRARHRPVVAGFDPARIRSPAYRRFFFTETRIVDKVSVAAPSPSTSYYVNFYRLERSDRFAQPQRQALQAIAPLLGRIVGRHYEAAGPMPGLPWAGLSVQERQVCRMIVEGLSTEAIALNLGVAQSSVVTYRRRAYRKLGIASRVELFNLSRAATLD